MSLYFSRDFGLPQYAWSPYPPLPNMDWEGGDESHEMRMDGQWEEEAWIIR